MHRNSRTAPLLCRTQHDFPRLTCVNHTTSFAQESSAVDIQVHAASHREHLHNTRSDSTPMHVSAIIEAEEPVSLLMSVFRPPLSERLEHSRGLHKTKVSSRAIYLVWLYMPSSVVFLFVPNVCRNSSNGASPLGASSGSGTGSGSGSGSGNGMYAHVTPSPACPGGHGSQINPSSGACTSVQGTES